LAYCLKNLLVASVLFGATKVSQVDDNLRALEVTPLLNEEIIAKMQVLVST
jgi:aryl-alcohol dehydrogenase-like predicted oxidoreductase